MEEQQNPINEGANERNGDQSNVPFDAQSSAQAIDHVINHISGHAGDHVSDHASGHVSGYASDHVSAHADDLAQTPAHGETHEPDGHAHHIPSEPASEAGPVTLTGTRAWVSHADVSGTQGDEEAYEHPFFDLPPLQRSKRKLIPADDETRTEGFDLWKILLAFLICMLFAMGSYLVGKVYGASLIPDEPIFIQIPEEDLPAGETPPAENPGPRIVTILLMGTDQRDNYEMGRADTIILAAINLDSMDIHLISIPRDTRTLIADSMTTTKINHAHATGGPELMVKTVENLLGLNVHYFVETNFKGFANCIDILGGVDYHVERRMLFIEEGIDLMAGQQRLDGDKALQYVRWRGDPTADIGRVARQQNFIKALLEQSIRLTAVPKIPSLVNELRENVKTDMTAAQMINLAARFIDYHNLSFSSVTLPGEAKTISGGAYWVMDTEATDELLLSIFDPTPEAEDEDEETPPADQDDATGQDDAPADQGDASADQEDAAAETQTPAQD